MQIQNMQSGDIVKQFRLSAAQTNNDVEAPVQMKKCEYVCAGCPRFAVFGAVGSLSVHCIANPTAPLRVESGHPFRFNNAHKETRLVVGQPGRGVNWVGAWVPSVEGMSRGCSASLQRPAVLGGSRGQKHPSPAWTQF